MKHTPGPWEAFTEDHMSGWWAIRQVTNDELNHEVGSTDGGFDKADALLMAASPELLEALRELDECYCEAGNNLTKEDRHRHRMTLIKARAAIQKATAG